VTPPPDRSYRALLAVPSLTRILVSMAVARIAGAMVSIAIVLFTLSTYHSPELAGAVLFSTIMPGLLVSPIAGALLDRHGRTRLVMLDYFVGAAALVLVGGLALAGALPPWLLVLITGVASLTTPLSNTGLRSLFPILVPEHLWERINAIDSNGYVASTLIGPPIAASMVQVVGGPVTLVGIGVMLALAALILIGTREPATQVVTSGRLLRDALDGLLYSVRNRTILGLGLTMTSLNLGWGMLTIAIPIMVLDRFHVSEAFVGLAWAVAGAFGIVAALYVGRLDSRGREKGWLVWSSVGCAAAVALLLVNLSLPTLLIAMAITGLTNGPLDIALFTLRQRRTDPAWMGRAFAVSASFNFAGYPVGSILAGAIVTGSLELTILLGAAACLLGGFLAWWQIPQDVAAPVPEVAAAT
jgi:MFS family permease